MNSRYKSPSARERMHEEARREREWLYLNGAKSTVPAYTLASTLAAVGRFVKPAGTSTTT